MPRPGERRRRSCRSLLRGNGSVRLYPGARMKPDPRSSSPHRPNRVTQGTVTLGRCFYGCDDRKKPSLMSPKKGHWSTQQLSEFLAGVAGLQQHSAFEAASVGPRGPGSRDRDDRRSPQVVASAGLTDGDRRSATIIEAHRGGRSVLPSRTSGSAGSSMRASKKVSIPIWCWPARPRWFQPR